MDTQQPDRSNVSRGCARMTLALVGLLGLVCVGAAGMTLMFFRTEEGQRAWRLSKAAAGAAWNAAGAPGTAELRAIGCRDAMVMDMGSIAAEISPPGEDLGAAWIVMCRSHFLDAPPSVDQVLATYMNAVGEAPGPFVVAVQRASSQERVIGGPYDIHGVLMPDQGGP